MSFYDNNTAKMEYNPDQYHEEGITWSKYSISNNKLCFEINNEIFEGFDTLFPNVDSQKSSKECFIYDFTNEDKTLILNSEGITFVFTKK